MEIKGDITVKRTGIFERRADQGLLSNYALGASATLVRNCARWQDLGSTASNVDIIMPDATQLPKGWEVVINNTAPGPVDAISIVLPTGSGLSPGTYTGVAVTGGNGTSFTADVIVDGGGQVTTVNINAAGSAYLIGDILTIAGNVIGGTTPAQDIAVTVTDTNNIYSIYIYNGDLQTPILLQEITKPTNPSIGAYLFTLLDNSTTGGRWYVTSLENSGDVPASRYTKNHNNTSDWAGPTYDEYYTISVTSSTHGRGDKPAVQFFGGTGIIRGTNTSTSLTNGETANINGGPETATVIKNWNIVTSDTTQIPLLPGEGVTFTGGTAIVVSCTSTTLVLRNFTTPGLINYIFTGDVSGLTFTCSSTNAPTQVLYIQGETVLVENTDTLTGVSSSYVFTATANESYENVTPDNFEVATNGNVTFSVPSDPDIRYTGRAIFI
jgi:hypothetical protein